MAEYDYNAVDTWMCSCGKTNTGKFCVKCGAPRPAAPAPQSASPAEWACACGRINTGKFCASCGAPRPAAKSGNVPRPENGKAVMPPRGNNPAVGTVAMPPRNHKPPAEEAAAPAEAPAEEKIDFSNVEIEPLFKDFVDFETFSKSDFRAVKVKDCTAVPKSKKLLKFTLDDGSGTDRTILSGIHAFYEPEEMIGKTLIAIVNLPPRPMMGMESCGMLLSALHKVNGEEKLQLLMVDPHIPAGAKLY